MGITDLPSPGMDTAAQDPLVTAGGSAANCAATVARLGQPVNLVAQVGNDLFSRVIVDDLVSFGVGTSGLLAKEGPSALVVALIEPTGQRTFISARGPATDELPGDSYLPLLNGSSMVHISGYAFQDAGSRATALHILQAAQQRRVPTSLDPSPMFPTHYNPQSGWLRGIDYLFPNAQEATAITGEESIEGAAATLLDLGSAAVAITMGADGCFFADAHGTEHFPAYRDLPVVDTTGAGDGFAGGFLAVILSGGSSRQACAVGNLVAAHVIAERGGHTGSPSAHDLAQSASRFADTRLLEAVGTLTNPSPVISTG